MDAVISLKEQMILKRAIKLLTPFNKEKESMKTYYFKNHEDGDELCEYDCCDNSKCIKKTEKELKSEYPELCTVCTYNDGDHERIDSCYQCGRPLNSSLTWIDQELEHHVKHTVTKREIKQSRASFDLIALFSAYPSADNRLSNYAKHQLEMGNDEPYKRCLEYQNEFTKIVIDYATHVIKTLK